MFTGGCVVVALWEGDLNLNTVIGRLVTLATVANALFIGMMMLRVNGRALIAGGILYAVIQVWLAWKGELSGEIGPLTVFVLALFAFKAVVLVFAALDKAKPA